MARLGDICDVRDGTHDSPIYVDSGYPLVTSKNIVDGKLDLTVINYITLEDYNKINERSKVDSGDIIMPMIGTIGNPYLVKEFTEFAIKNVALIKFNNEQINNKYIYYFLNSDKFKEYIAKNNRGGTQKFISLKDMRNMEINIPSLYRQLKTVEILDKVSSLINYQKQQVLKLDELIKSRFIELFGDPETNPKDWVRDVLFNHLNVVGGYAFKSELFIEEGVPVLRIGNINAGFFQPINMVYWKYDDSLSRYMMYAGDLVMSLTGTVGKDDYGNVCILGNDYDCYYLNQRNAKLELFSTLDKYYLSQILKFSAVKKKLTGISRGVRQANISNKDILNLEIPIPPIELQNQFATFVEQTDKLKFEAKQSLEKLEMLKKALMQEYFG